MALGVDPARDRQADEFQRGARRLARVGVHAAEHHATDLDGPDAGVAIQGTDQSLAREELGRDVRAERGGVDVNGVAARRLDDLDPRR